MSTARKMVLGAVFFGLAFTRLALAALMEDRLLDFEPAKTNQALKATLTEMGIGVLPGADSDPALLEAHIAELKGAVAADPKNAEHLRKLGELLTRAQRLPEASEIYWRAARLEPDRVTSLHYFGFTLLAMGDHANGLKVYHLLHTRLGNVGKVLMNLSSAHYGLKEYQKASYYMDLYLLMTPREDPRAYYNMGLILLAGGKPKEAMTYFEKCRPMMPDHPALAAATIRAARELKWPPEKLDQLMQQAESRFSVETLAPLLNAPELPVYLDR